MENSLYLCKAEIYAPIVAEDEDEAYTIFMDNWCEVITSVFEEVPLAVKNEVVDKIHHLTPDSIWNDYIPHGDYYGPQEACRYYTSEEKEKRKAEKKAKEDRAKDLLKGLTPEEVSLLRDHFIPQDVREEVLEIISLSKESDASL